MKQIKCDTLEDFMEVIFKLVEKGLTFKSNASTLTIDLLGGF